MPTKEIERWRRDGIDMRRQLEQLGYEVDLQFAGNDSATQASQIEHMIANNAKALVITFVNGGEEQYSVLEHNAKAAQLSVSEYIRRSVTGQKIPVFQPIIHDEHEILEELRKINKVGSNLNQIARHLNQGV